MKDKKYYEKYYVNVREITVPQISKEWAFKNIRKFGTLLNHEAWFDNDSEAITLYYSGRDLKEV